MTTLYLIVAFLNGHEATIEAHLDPVLCAKRFAELCGPGGDFSGKWLDYEVNWVRIDTFEIGQGTMLATLEFVPHEKFNVDKPQHIYYVEKSHDVGNQSDWHGIEFVAWDMAEAFKHFDTECATLTPKESSYWVCHRSVYLRKVLLEPGFDGCIWSWDVERPGEIVQEFNGDDPDELAELEANDAT